MGKPLIGLTSRRWSAALLGDALPRAMQGLSFDLHFVDYAKSVALAGGLPVELSRDADVTEIVGHLEGLVLSGGADVDPALYGALPDVNIGLVDRERDDWELSLLAAAREADLPILAICRGFQLVNVAHGGTLRQHVSLEEGAGHPQWDVDGHQATHQVTAVPGTRGAEIFAPLMSVNSLHHQTLMVVGEGLVVNAVASDGVVEGFETPDGSVLGVQWHPELLSPPDATFTWLVREALSRREERADASEFAGRPLENSR